MDSETSDHPADFLDQKRLMLMPVKRTPSAAMSSIGDFFGGGHDEGLANDSYFELRTETATMILLLTEAPAADTHE